jgi:hypothetical protein
VNAVDQICEHLRSVLLSDEPHRLESALAATDKQAAVLFSEMSANDVFAYRDARKAVQSRLNRMLAARQKAAR